MVGEISIVNVLPVPGPQFKGNLYYLERSATEPGRYYMCMESSTAGEYYWWEVLDGDGVMEMKGGLYVNDRYRKIWNSNKHRVETWTRHVHYGVVSPWVLVHAEPGIKWEETYITPGLTFVGVLGLALDHTWALNGDPAGAAGNFVSLGTEGGGLILRDLGAGVNDWIALHTGLQYPFRVIHGSTAHWDFRVPTNTNVRGFIGLVGAAGLETGDNAPWTVPNEGIYFWFDTNVDARLYAITRTGGVQTATDIGLLPAIDTCVNILVSDDAQTITFMMNSNVVATHTTNIPQGLLKPLTMVGCRTAAVQGDMYLTHFYIIFDDLDI